MYDVVVVGAGSAGCALAGRLVNRTHGSARVLLVEAGPREVWTADVGSLAATAPGHPRNWSHAAQLRTGTDAVVPRGRGFGGSGAINGAVWTYVTPADAAGWDTPGWSYSALRHWYSVAERDGIHHSDGPIPVLTADGALRHASTDRFLAASTALGFPAEPDLNAGGPPGAGLVPSNSRDGQRIDAARAYLPRPVPPGVQLITWPRSPEVRSGTTVDRVSIVDGRADGVVLADGEHVAADEVVLCAGAVGTPRILMRSGLGPADVLRAVGIDVRVDLPGVGRGWSDHPAVFLPFRTDDPPPHPHAPTSQAALHWDAGADPAGDVEVLLFTRPFVPDGDLHLMCSLQQPDSRGVLDLDRISYGYLRTEHDRRRLRHAIRTAADLLRAGLGTRTEPDGDVLGNDRTLDAWIAGHLTTAVHLCGSAALGRVVDPDLRVLGVDGLRVADTSILPLAPRRGPAATAVAIGEKAAALLANPATPEEPPGESSI